MSSQNRIALRALAALLAFTLPLLAAGHAGAMPGKAEADGLAPNPSFQPKPLKGVTVLEHLGETVPADLVFTNEAGQQVALSSYLGKGRPVILNLVYFNCPMLCNLVMSGLVRALRETRWTIGKDVDVVTVSIDPRDTPSLATQRRRGYLQTLNLPPETPGWSFLTTTDEKAVRQLADSVGFAYTFDPASGQYAHAAAMFVLTPQGKISRYLYGISFAARELRLALAEAAQGKAGAAFDRLLLQCFRYDPVSRKYQFFINNFIRVGGGLVLLGLVVILVRFWRRELLSEAAA
jgi:protein SCO1/2